jgi:hypothetical protein|tara:strand:+ start:2692 stop:2838 length:147 start_codon:yes stop_codon:yes gene_type:complete
MNKQAIIASIITGAGTVDLFISRTFDITFSLFLICFIFSIIWLYKSDK